MLERIWQIQDLEEALEKYEHLREKYERREQKEYGTSIIRIGIGWWLAVLISIPLSAIAPSLLIACMDMAKHLQALDVIAFVSLFLLSIPHVAGVLHSKLLRTRKANGKCRMRVQHMTWAQHTKDNNLTDIRR